MVVSSPGRRSGACTARCPQATTGGLAVTREQAEGASGGCLSLALAILVLANWPEQFPETRRCP